MRDPANDQFADMSLLDLSDLRPASAPQSQVPSTQEPVQTPMYTEFGQEPRMSAAQAMAKAGSIVPGEPTAPSPGAPSVPVVRNASGTYTPFVLAAVGAVAGGMYAGWWGAASGALAVGALLNANRWRKGYPSKTTDGAFALATMGGAVYAGYKAHKYRVKKAPTPSREPDVLELDDDEDDKEEVEPNSARPAKRAWLKPVKR